MSGLPSHNLKGRIEVMPDGEINGVSLFVLGDGDMVSR